MKLSRRIAINGNQLDQVDPSIVIRSIDPGTTKETVQTSGKAGGSGQRITEKHWDSLEVSVSYAINIPKKQLAARRAVFDAVNAWALQKGWVTINYMPGKRMYNQSVTIPSSGDLWEWESEFTITFRAYGVPFWQDSQAATATIEEEDSGSGSITVPGVAKTVCEADITNESSGTINTLEVNAGSSSFSFTNLGLEAGERLVIGHYAETGDLYIRKYTGLVATSVMDKRTGGSDDDLFVNPGANAVTITGGTVSATVSAYGRYV